MQRPIVFYYLIIRVQYLYVLSLRIRMLKSALEIFKTLPIGSIGDQSFKNFPVLIDMPCSKTLHLSLISLVMGEVDTV